MPLQDLFKKANHDNYDISVAKDMPLYPGAALTAHVLYKNIQVGSTLGSGVGIAWWLARPKTDALFRAAWPRAALKGAGVGVLTATSMMLYKMQEIDLEGLEDRAYRLNNNKQIQALDFCTTAGAMIWIMPAVFMRHAKGANGLWPLGYGAQAVSVSVIGFMAAQAAGLDIADTVLDLDPTRRRRRTQE